MKNNSAALFLKHIISVLGSVAKSKSMSLRNKTNAMKDRFAVYSLMKNRKLSLAAIRHKIHALLGNDSHGEEDENNKAIVLYNAKTSEVPSTSGQIYLTEYEYDHEEKDDDDKYPDLRHSLFDEDDLDLGDPNASAIDLVKNSKEDSENFNLEDEIDQVADLFILKFRKKMRLQKLESFKRYQEMLERGT
ncbi:unnamed protein product [Fraxinus pennsylvanica]|uniref:DUF761 domain-containing protein n=1 Tax=Fraxinus pennsylvanica TaxID=56036 RepID=A0AAD2E174_9LAMI|nr:unnamed protein product [Fraxinus pennsylvanica]